MVQAHGPGPGSRLALGAASVSRDSDFMRIEGLSVLAVE